MSLQGGMRTCEREIKATVRVIVKEIHTWIAAGSVSGETGYGVSQREIQLPVVYVDTCICNLISLERAERFVVCSLSELQFSSEFVQSVKTDCALYAHNSARSALERCLNKLEIALEFCFWRDHYLNESEERENLHVQRGFGAIPATDAAIMTALKTIIFKKGAEKSSCDCIICLDEILEDTQASQTPCLHLFHQECIVNWLRQSNCCPICRFRIQEAVA